MLDLDTRRAVLLLRARGHGIKRIARDLKVSKNSVRRVLESGRAEVPRLEREAQASEHIDTIRRLHGECEGNLVRVHEELAKDGVEIGYSTLTGFCRRHGIGVAPKERAGRYDFGPGEEMQHDTSPHKVPVGGRRRSLQCASLVLCFSRSIYAQLYPVWTRFHAKLFLTEALESFGGAASRCMVDNSNLVIAHGTGRGAVVVPEMVAFGDRFGFVFIAHELGDANRSARVEGPFYYIERNFYPGRTFSDLRDLNRQLRQWCHDKNGALKRSLKARPSELLAAERPLLRPLPSWIPPVYDLHHRMVDLEGYVSLHGNRYSVSADLIGRQVSVREERDLVRVFDGHREDAVHERVERGEGRRSTLARHRRDARARRASKTAPELREERELRAASPELGRLLDALRRKHVGRAVRAVRLLHRMYIDYPNEPLIAAVRECLKYGLTDLERLENMVLRRIAGDFFKVRPRRGGRDDE